MDLAYNIRNSGMHLAACAAVPFIFLCLFNTASPAVDTMPGMNMQAPIGSIFNSTSDDAIHSKDANRSARHTSGHYVCSGKDIRFSQHYLGFSADGIPEFALEIVNTCRSKKTMRPYNVHVYCGQFASYKLVDPKIFRRCSTDDCLVLDGKPLRRFRIIRIVYANGTCIVYG